MRIFRSKKWKQKTKTRNDEILFEKPLSFPKVKLRKNIQSDKEQVVEPPVKKPLHLSKSLPVRKPVRIVWEEIQEFQRLIPDKKTVATQTSFCLTNHNSRQSILTNQSSKQSVLTNQDSVQQILTNQREESSHRKLTRSSISSGHKKVSLQLSNNSKASSYLTNQKRASFQVSNDDEDCNLEVYKTFCNPAHQDSGLPSSSSSYSRDASGISSVIR